jgi:hypothetical protein
MDLLESSTIIVCLSTKGCFFMLEFGYAICTILMFLLLIICMAAEIADAFNPKLKLMDTIRPIVFAATLAMFPLIIHFFGLFIDYSWIKEFIADIPDLWRDMLSMFMGCPYP